MEKGCSDESPQRLDKEKKQGQRRHDTLLLFEGQCESRRREEEGWKRRRTQR